MAVKSPSRVANAIRRRRPSRKARTFVQRTFIRWFDERRAGFAVPVRLGRRTDRQLQLVVTGAPSAMDFVLMSDGPQVFVNLQGRCWDWIHWGEIAPEKSPGGYTCVLDEERPRKIYPTRETIWREHCFEEFLTWFNTVYATSTWLACYGGKGGGSTWAQLSSSQVPPGDPTDLCRLSRNNNRKQMLSHE